MEMRGPRIELEIGELVLHGIPATERHRVGDAFRAELERLLAEQGHVIMRESAAIERLDAGSAPVCPGVRPEAIGVAVAWAVFAAQGRAGAAPRPPADPHRRATPQGGR